MMHYYRPFCWHPVFLDTALPRLQEYTGLHLLLLYLWQLGLSYPASFSTAAQYLGLYRLAWPESPEERTQLVSQVRCWILHQCLHY